MEGTYYLQIGTILHDRYEIKDILGAGGFGITYKAWDNTLQTEVCIKEYYPVGIANRTVTASQVSVYTNADEASYKRGMQRFLREARGLAKLGSVKNIVNVHDYFEENNTAYMVMEYLKGKTLKCFVRENGGKVNEDVAIHVACSVLEALQHVHAVGIIHRDISPDNIYICDNMEVKLIDFGALKQEIAEVNKSTSIILKYGFAPPEQYTSNSREQGAWTDIYAVGATVYYILTGLIPQDSVMRMMEDVLVPLEEIIPSISKNFSDAIMKAMSLNIRDRFASAEDFLNELLSDTETNDTKNRQQRKKSYKDNYVKSEKKTKGRHEKTEKKENQHSSGRKKIMPFLIAGSGLLVCCVITILLLIKYQVIDIKSNEPPFEYEDKQIVIDTMYLFEKYVNVGDDYVDYYINDGSKFEKSIVKEIKNVEEKYDIGEFEQYDQYIYAIDFDIQNVDYKIQNYKHSVRVMVTNHAENRDVYITVWFKENPEYYIKLDQAEQTYNADQVKKEIEEYYDSEEEFFDQYGSYYSSIDDVVQQGIESEMKDVYEYLPSRARITVK
jgi:kinase domain protein